MAARKFKFWGWGYADELVDDPTRALLASRFAKQFGASELPATSVPKVQDFDLRKPRIAPPAPLAAICSSDPEERLIHAYGKSFPDSARMFARQCPHPPDVVARPRNEADVIAVLDWADRADAAVIPFGGGSSVVGGVEPNIGGRYKGAITLNLQALDKVLEVDKVSRAARIQAGALGPALEKQLQPHGLTLRHFPQSFQYSTLGGWIATRSGGHFATLYTHIDDLVESIRAVTPAGISESRRLPGSGAGPSPDRMFLGSEGILGVITEAWMRLQARPTFRAGTSVRFADFYKAADALRAISQAGLYPSNCRVIDATEALLTGAGDGASHILVLAFENADHPVDTWMKRALELARDFGGAADDAKAAKADAHREGASGAWRDAFIRAPFFREVLTGLGVMYDTFETSMTWERFPDFHAKLMRATADAIKRVTGRPGVVTCRFTHAYPDGPAPYFSFHCLGRKDALIQQWHEIKTAASDELIKLGGTITHHHAVGRDHRPWYDRQRPEPFAQALKAAKRAVDPKGLLNPGVLIDP
ncbi:MAG TPA: FAD-binding oxidoreductase [Candidatus Cybelea sp.]|nr:FAD-binding oxidoreductase [Candidatus Cybelea sp.]